MNGNQTERDELIIDETCYETILTEKYRKRKKYEPDNPNHVKAYIPGIIWEIYVTTGQAVKEGDPLLALEAMKMKNSVMAPRDGVIKEIHVSLSQMVTKNQLLIELG